MIFHRNEIKRINYSNKGSISVINAFKSSFYNSPYSVKVVKNVIRLNNSSESVLNVLYLENSETQYNKLLFVHNGNNIFVRSKKHKFYSVKNRRLLSGVSDDDELKSLTIAPQTYEIPAWGIGCVLDYITLYKIWCIGSSNGELNITTEGVWTWDGLSFTFEDTIDDIIISGSNHMVFIGNIIYMISQHSNHLKTYDIITQDFNSSFSQLPSLLNSSTMTSNNESILYFSCRNAIPGTEVFSYNITSNTWLHMGNTSASHSKGGIEYYNNTLIILGGFSASTDKIEIVSNIDNNGFIVNTSLQQANFPDTLFGFSTNIIPYGLIYIFGGIFADSNVTNVSSSIYVYNIINDCLYLSNISLNIGRTSFGSAFDLSGKLWVIGGLNESFFPIDSIEFSNKFDTYEPTIEPTFEPTMRPTRNENDKLKSMTIASFEYPSLSGGVGCILDNVTTHKIWCIGGDDKVGTHVNVYTFNGTNFKFEGIMIGNRLTSFGNHMEIINNIIYLISKNGNCLKTYNISSGLYNVTFTQYPTNLVHSRITSDNKNMIYFCCNINVINGEKIHSFNITANNWTMIGYTNKSHGSGSIEYYNNQLIVIGGLCTYCASPRKIEIISDIDNNNFVLNYSLSADSILPLHFNFNTMLLDNGIIYIIGGNNNLGIAVDYIFVYDIITDDTYKSDVNLTGPRFGFASVVDLDKRLWIIAGANITNRAVKTIEYSNDFDSISPTLYPTLNPTLKPTRNENDGLKAIHLADVIYPIKSAGLGCVIDNTTDTILCIGNNLDDNNRVSVYKFNGSNFELELVTNGSVSVYGNHMEIIDNIIYLIDDNSNYIITYNTLTKTLNTTFAMYPTELNNSRITSNKQNIIYFCCNSNTDHLLDIHSFDIHSKEWTIIGNTSNKHGLGSIEYYNNQLFVIGGLCICPTNHKIEIISDIDNNNFMLNYSLTADSILPHMFRFSTNVLNNGIIYIISGVISLTQIVNSIFIYDITMDNLYQSDVVLNTPRIGFGSVLDSENRLWIIAGSNCSNFTDCSSIFRTIEISNDLDSISPTISPTRNPTISPTRNPTVTPTRNPTTYPSRNNIDNLKLITITSLKYPIRSSGLDCVLDNVTTHKIWCISPKSEIVDTINVYSFNGSYFNLESNLVGNVTQLNHIELIGNILYLVDHNTSYIKTYDIITKTFNSTFAATPVVFEGSTITSNNENSIYFCCNINTPIPKDLYSFNITSHEWNIVGNTSYFHVFGGIEYYNSQLIVISGLCPECQTNHKIEILSDLENNNFVLSQSLSADSVLPIEYILIKTEVLDSGIIYIIGGADSNNTTRNIYVYDIITDYTYKSDVALSFIRLGFATVFDLDFRLWIIGGINSTNDSISTIEYSNDFNSVSPTLYPSLNPTIIPTLYPTLEPSNNPTVQPSNNPSNYPTVEPSNNPTFEPSNNPTLHPSNDPTFQPSNNPTLEPSNNPTVHPSNNPSNDLTVEPSNNPTLEPTKTPTKYPTYSTDDYNIILDGNIKLKTSYNTIIIDEIPHSDLEIVMYNNVITVFGFENNTNLIRISVQNVKSINDNSKICINYDIIVYDFIDSNLNAEALKDDVTSNNNIKNSTIDKLINAIRNYIYNINNISVHPFDNTTDIIFSVDIKMQQIGNKSVGLSDSELAMVVIFSIVGFLCFFIILYVYLRICKKNGKTIIYNIYNLNVGKKSKNVAVMIGQATNSVDPSRKQGECIEIVTAGSTKSKKSKDTATSKNSEGKTKQVYANDGINPKEIFETYDKTNEKRVKNACVVLVGAVDYSTAIVGKNDNIHDLPQVKDDIVSAKNMFKTVYNYKHVYHVIDKIKNKKANTVEYINPDNLRAYLQYVRSLNEVHNQTVLNKDESSSESSESSEELGALVDCLIVIISGHGNKNGFITNTGKVFNFEFLEEIFSNQNFSTLSNCKKIFIVDTCRGNDIIEWNTTINNLTGKGTGSSTVWVTSTSDILYFYATTKNKQAYVDNKNGGSYLINGIINVFGDKQMKGKENLYNMTQKAKRYVQNASGGIQTSETVDRLDYHVIFE